MLNAVVFGRRSLISITLQPRESQRDAARILLAHLHVVERDFDDELGSNMNCVRITRDLALEECFGLPAQRVVGHSVERLGPAEDRSKRSSKLRRRAS